MSIVYLMDDRLKVRIRFGFVHIYREEKDGFFNKVPPKVW